MTRRWERAVGRDPLRRPQTGSLPLVIPIEKEQPDVLMLAPRVLLLAAPAAGVSDSPRAVD